MNVMTKRIRVGRDHHLKIELDLPADFPEGEAELIINLQCIPAQGNEKSRIQEVSGKGRGKFWMADDFDAPLADFSEYR